MRVPVRSIKGVVPWVVVIKTQSEEFFLKGSRRKIALFKSRDSAEQQVLELSVKHPKWKFIIKQSNGVPL